MEVQGLDSVEDHQPETLDSHEESLHPMSHSSVSKNHEEESYLENIHISVQISDCIHTFRRAAASYRVYMLLTKTAVTSYFYQCSTVRLRKQSFYNVSVNADITKWACKAISTWIAGNTHY